MYSSIYAGCMWHYLISRGGPISIDVLQQDGTLSMMVFDINHLSSISKSPLRAATARQKTRL